MKTKKMRIAFAGIAIALVSMTIIFASSGTHAQDEGSNNLSELVNDMDVSTDVIALNESASDCGPCCQVSSDCNPSNCSEECLTACHDKMKKTCNGKTTCGSGPGCSK